MPAKFRRRKIGELIQQMKMSLIKQGVPEEVAEKKAREAFKASVAVSSPPKNIREYKQLISELKEVRSRLKASLRRVKSEQTKEKIAQELEQVTLAIEKAEEKMFLRQQNPEKLSPDKWVKEVEEKARRAQSDPAYTEEEKEFYAWYRDVVREIAEALKKKKKI